MPLLYLRGLSTGDFREALPALLGKDAGGLSPTAITTLRNRDFANLLAKSDFRAKYAPNTDRRRSGPMSV